MYSLIKAGIATKSELDEAYTLDEALKLYALYSMDRDIERFQAEEMQAEMADKKPAPRGSELFLLRLST